MVAEDERLQRDGGVDLCIGSVRRDHPMKRVSIPESVAGEPQTNAAAFECGKQLDLTLWPRQRKASEIRVDD